MKIRHLFAALAIVPFVLLSCNTKEAETANTDIPVGDMTFHATFGDGQNTKIVVKNENEIWWNPYDAINVFYGNLTSGKFTAQIAQDAATTSFTGSLSMATGTIETSNEPRSFWAVYPYNSDNTCDGNSVTLTVADNQTGAEGTFAPKMFPAIAQSTGLDLAFYNVCGGMVFTVTRDDIKAVTLTGRNEETLVGSVRVAFESGLPAVKEIIQAGKSVTLKNSGGKPFTPGVRYYITALPGTFTKGYELTFGTTSGQAGTKTVTDSKTINRSRFIVVNDADSGVTFTGGSGADPNIIQFADENLKEKLVAAFDTDGDGELSYAEAAAVSSPEDFLVAFGTTRTFRSFDEFQYFTGLSYIYWDTFKNWTLLKSIVLPDSIKRIGEDAFENCTQLSSVSIPDGVTYLGGWAFNGCRSLKSITLPEGLSSIGQFAFQDCASLESITLPEGLQKIEMNTFRRCTSLVSITLPKDMTVIESGAFSSCVSVEHVFLSDYSMFSACKSNDSIPYYDSKQAIHLYLSGSELTSLVFPEETLTIPSYILKNCAYVKFVFIPEGVASIRDYAFSGCTSLESITFPDGLVSIGTSAFAYCTSLASVVFPEGLSSIGSRAFEGCTSLASAILPDGLYSIDSYAFNGCTSLTSVTFPEGLSSIGNGAFYRCISLASVSLHEGLSSMGGDTFRECTSLRSVSLPEGLSRIEDFTFSGCTSLETVSFPDGLSSIGNEAFEGCTCLKSVVFPDGLGSIGSWAFATCTSLASITLPEGLSSIKHGAFKDCSNLSSITVNAKDVPRGAELMFDNTGNCPIYVPVESVNAYKSAQYWSDYANRIQAIKE